MGCVDGVGGCCVCGEGGCCVFFFFNDTATTEIYTLSLHDALPIWGGHDLHEVGVALLHGLDAARPGRSEEHTSELQSPCNLVCRLLLEKKKNKIPHMHPNQPASQYTYSTDECHT